MELFDKKFVYLEWDDCLKGKKVLVGDSLKLMCRQVNDGTVKLRCIEDNSRNSELYPFMDEFGTTWSLVYYDPNYECELAYAQGKTIQFRYHDDADWANCVENPKWLDICEYRVKPEDSDRCLLIINDYNEVGIVKEGREWKGCLIKKGTEEECKDYIVNNYCNKCVHQLSLRCGAFSGCQGFKEREEVGCDSCQYQGTPDTENPCMTCVGYDNYKPRQKRRMTNRELAKWLAEGNGECMCDDISMSCWRYICDEADIPVKDGVQVRGWDETEWCEPLMGE